MDRENRNERQQRIFNLLTKSHPEWKIRGMTYTEIKDSEKRSQK